MSNNDATIALLEKHFEITFAAPDGIKKLRELILSLAMQGKLVSQDLNEQPASELLKEIEAEKKRLVKDGKIKQFKPLPEIKPDEVPYDLPKGWEWVCFDHIAENSKNALKAGPFGSALKKSMYVPSGFKIYGQEQVISGDENFGDYFIDKEKYCSLESCSVKSGDILISLVGTIGKVLVLSGSCQPGIINPRLVKISLYKDINREFIKRLLSSPLIQMELSDKSHGGTMNILNLGLLRNLLLPLPPITEQRRIVAKIDELMARCDELEKLRSDRDRKQIIVHNSALNRLLIAKEQSDFNTSWQFITQHFSELYSVKENVTELRKAILQLAVMGKLVPQDPNDQPASELLKEIEKEKQRLIKEGKIKKSKPLPEIKPDEIPYNLPKGWECVRLSSIVESIDYGTSQKTVDDSTMIPVYRMGNIIEGRLVNYNLKYINKDIDDLPRLYLQKMDILFNRTNSYELVGKSAIYLGDNNKATFASYLIRIRLIKKEIMPNYIIRVINSTYFRKTQIEPEIVQQCGQANFNGSKLSLCLFPLPPLAEQHRIVAKIDQLMALCDNLEKQIDNVNNKQTNLLNAVMTKI